MTIKELESKREARTAYLIMETLGSMFAADPDKIINLLTGYLWDEEEAGYIKRQARTE